MFRTVYFGTAEQYATCEEKVYRGTLGFLLKRFLASPPLRVQVGTLVNEAHPF